MRKRRIFSIFFFGLCAYKLKSVNIRPVGIFRYQEAFRPVTVEKEKSKKDEKSGCGSTGQNAFEQARQFTDATQVTSLAVTKLDGTAKGGVIIGISDQFRIPVRYIGIGEGIDQLKIFDRQEFVNALFGE